MNTKLILFFSFLCLALMLVSCAADEAVETVEEEEVVEESSISEEDLELNTESADVSYSTSREVVIENSRFNPPDISVSVGDTVEWINLDDVDHTITFEDARFDVKIPAGGTVSYTFEETGVARYFSQYYPSTQGSVLVE